MVGGDWMKTIKKLFEKYRYAALVLAVGLILMLWPGGSKPETLTQQPSTAEVFNMQDSLEEILSQIQGVGKVRVLLTEQAGAETYYEKDEDSSISSDSQSIRNETIIISDGSRAEGGLVRQIIPPVYLGAVIVCQGGDQPQVRLAVVEAVCDATGLSADRVTVLKMK